MFVKRSPRKRKVKVAGTLVPTRSHILVLVFAATRKERRSGASTPRGVMISIKLNDMYIGHDRSLQVCLYKRSCIALHRIASVSRRYVVFVLSSLDVRSVAISFRSGLCRYG